MKKENDMIRISRDGVKVKVTLRTSANVEACCLAFDLSFGNDLVADLVEQDLRNRLFEMMASVRKQAYEEGWHDKASKKRPKRTWFVGVASLTRGCSIGNDP
jgi:hypothetical protein